MSAILVCVTIGGFCLQAAGVLQMVPVKGWTLDRSFRGWSFVFAGWVLVVVSAVLGKAAA